MLSVRHEDCCFEIVLLFKRHCVRTFGWSFVNEKIFSGQSRQLLNIHSGAVSICQRHDNSPQCNPLKRVHVVFTLSSLLMYNTNVPCALAKQVLKEGPLEGPDATAPSGP